MIPRRLEYLCGHEQHPVVDEAAGGPDEPKRERGPPQPPPEKVSEATAGHGVVTKVLVHRQATEDHGLAVLGSHALKGVQGQVGLKRGK